MPRGGLRLNAGRKGRDATVEDCRSIDIRAWSRAGMLCGPWAGRWEWRDPDTRELTSSISVRTGAGTVELNYKVRGAQVAERIEFVRTPCHKGGDRPWFLCPGCGRRVAILLMLGQRFRCRKCHDLPYFSQRQDEIGRAWLAQLKLERRLLPNWQRPKGMHHATRTRLVHKIFELEERREDLLEPVMQRLIKAGG